MGHGAGMGAGFACPVGILCVLPVAAVPGEFAFGWMKQVPPGATHCFVAAHDVHSGDDSAPNNDCKLEIARLA